jgi:hypothetical protein
MLPLYRPSVGESAVQQQAASFSASPTRPASLVKAAVKQLRARYNRKLRRWLRRNGPFLAFCGLLLVAWLLIRQFPHHHRLPSLKRSELEDAQEATEPVHSADAQEGGARDILT